MGRADVDPGVSADAGHRGRGDSKRMAKSGEAGFAATVALAGFESPKKRSEICLTVRTGVRMVACLLIPRFALRVTCPGQLDEPVALAPLPGARQAVGEVSRPAEAAGVCPGMPLGEALARCPSLRLIPPDPARAAERWDALLGRLEGIGAAVESERPGEAFFAVEGLRGIHGGEVAGVLEAARGAAQVPVRIAVAPNRFAAFARGQPRVAPASWTLGIQGRGGRPFPGASQVPRPASGLDADGPPRRSRAGGERVDRRLQAPGPGHPRQARGDLSEPDRRSLRLARAVGASPRPRQGHAARPREAPEELVAEIELPEGTAGAQLDRALELLVDRFLAAPQRRQRTVLALRLSALLDGGGSWSVEQGLGRPTASARVIGSLLSSRLASLPGPATALRLRALALGPRASRSARARARRAGVAAAAARSGGEGGSRGGRRRVAAQGHRRRSALPRTRAPGAARPLPRAMSRARRIYAPRAAAVRVGGDGTPLAARRPSPWRAIREEWVVEDRWWTERPLHRHYYELVLADGRIATVFRDVRTGRWQRQRA